MALYDLATMPNLPGYMTSSDSWIRLRQEGFHNKKERPRTAGSVRDSSPDLLHVLGAKKDIYTTRHRPTTASATRVPLVGEFAKEAEDPETRERIKEVLYDSAHSRTRPFTAGNARQFYQTNMQTGVNHVNSEGKFATYPGPYSQPLNPIPQKNVNPLTRSNQFLPKFVDQDRVVCRFHAHFYVDRTWDPNHPIGKPRIEQRVPRLLTIFYYLVDDTIEISEEKHTNSGLNGGQFYRRGKLEDTYGKEVQLKDFAPGNNIYALGREIFITDADPFTREYFRRELSTILPPALGRPEPNREDLGANYATGFGVVPKPRGGHFGISSSDYPAKKAMFDSIRRSLRYGNGTLQFHCVMLPSASSYNPDERTRIRDFIPTNKTKTYLLVFHLGDNTMEIHCPYAEAGEPKLILKRGRQPKNWREYQRGAHATWYEPSDFVCGQIVDIFGRQLLPIACDEQTKAHCAELGITQNDVDLMEIKEKQIVHPIPQLGDGFLPIGSPEDTLNTVYGVPKTHMAAYQNLLRNQSKILRAKAKMLTESNIDASRPFSVTFFLEDDSIQIFEESERNSGIVGGTFLKRGKYINTLPPEGTEARNFKAQDIYLGNVFSINGANFQIVEMDNMSLNFCEAYPDEFPMFNTFKIIGNLIRKAVSLDLNVRAMLAPMDPKGLNWVEEEVFVEGLDSLGLTKELNDQEILTLIRRFQDGKKYHYMEMADLFSYAYHMDHFKAQGRYSDFEGFMASLRTRKTQWRRTFRKDHLSIDGCLTVARLTKIFKKYNVVLSEDAKREIIERFRVGWDEETRILKILQKEKDDNLLAGITQRTETGKKKPLSSAKTIPATRLDLKSKLRMDQTRGTDSLTANIMRKRDAMSKNHLMRAYLKRSPAGHGGDFFKDQGEGDDKIVIDYHAFCTAIYPQTWLLPNSPRRQSYKSARPFSED